MNSNVFFNNLKFNIILIMFDDYDIYTNYDISNIYQDNWMKNILITNDYNIYFEYFLYINE